MQEERTTYLKQTNYKHYIHKEHFMVVCCTWICLLAKAVNDFYEEACS
jgi:hypothetical protein